MASSSSNSPAEGQNPNEQTVGVQALIHRLKSEGVHEGEQQAETLVAEARQQASAILAAARTEAEQILTDARRQAEQIENNGKRALSLASRDASLRLKEQLEHEFRSRLSELVSQQLDQPANVAEMIRELVAHATTMLDQTLDQGTGDGSTQTSPATRMRLLVAEGQAEAVEALVRQQAAEMLRDGVELHADRSLAHGFRIQIVDNGTEIDFSDEAVSAALMRFLAPKFRQLIGSDGEAE